MKRKKLISFLGLSGLLVVVAIFLIYKELFGINVKIKEDRAMIYIPQNASYHQAVDSIKAHLQIRNLKVFNWIANRKNYPRLVRPGRYLFERNLTYNELINILRSGRQNPVNVTFNNIRTLNELAGKIGKQINSDSLQLINFLSDPANYSKDGFTKENVIAIFIPNTYQFFWDTTPEKLYSRMLSEYRKFWNQDRLEKATEKNLSPIEVEILASIIDDEVAKPDEKPRIAGVYLNRLKRGIPLQACPTIKFALNDFTITRVLKKYLEVDSPYNTYKHKGFPPGPIGCPTIEGIDAVLNAEKNDYLFFAAKADFSGYHNFSRTLSEHNRYAAEYQRELNRRKIFR